MRLSFLEETIGEFWLRTISSVTSITLAASITIFQVWVGEANTGPAMSLFTGQVKSTLGKLMLCWIVPGEE